MHCRYDTLGTDAGVGGVWMELVAWSGRLCVAALRIPGVLEKALQCLQILRGIL